MSLQAGRVEDVEALRDELLHHPLGREPEPRFHCPKLLDLLLQESEALQADAPASAVFWADQALALADAMRNKRFLDSDAMARAARLKGNAQRLDGELEAAERSFALGMMHLGDASAERPWFLRALAVLRWEQDRPWEAISLLQSAAWLFLDQKLEGEEATCLSLVSLLWADTSTPLRGLAPLLHAEAQGAPVPEWLRLRCGFLKAAHLARMGAGPRARTALDATMRLYGRTRNEGEILVAYRLEGVARALLGDLEESEHLLEGVRRKQRARRNVQEVALTSLSLAAVVASQGRKGEIPRLEAEIRDGAFAPEEGGAFAQEALQSFQILLAQGARPWESAARAGAEFLRLCRRFDVRLQPIPFV